MATCESLINIPHSITSTDVVTAVHPSSHLGFTVLVGSGSEFGWTLANVIPCSQFLFVALLNWNLFSSGLGASPGIRSPTFLSQTSVQIFPTQVTQELMAPCITKGRLQAPVCSHFQYFCRFICDLFLHHLLALLPDGRPQSISISAVQPSGFSLSLRSS